MNLPIEPKINEFPGPPNKALPNTQYNVDFNFSSGFTPQVNPIIQNNPPTAPTNQFVMPPQQPKVLNEKVNTQSMEELLSLCVIKGASDLHISVGYPPLIRVNGDLIPLGSEIIDDNLAVKLFDEILQPRQTQQLQNY